MGVLGTPRFLAGYYEVKQRTSGILAENMVGDTKHRDRRFLTTIIGIAVAVTLGLLIFAFVTDFPGPPPAGDKELTSDAPAEDVRR